MPAARLAARAFRPRQKFPVITKRGVPHYVKPNGKTVNAALSDAQKFGKSAKAKRSATRKTQATKRKRSVASKKAAQTRKDDSFARKQQELKKVRSQVKDATDRHVAAARERQRLHDELGRMLRRGASNSEIRSQRAKIAAQTRKLKQAQNDFDHFGPISNRKGLEVEFLEMQREGFVDPNLNVPRRVEQLLGASRRR